MLFFGALPSMLNCIEVNLSMILLHETAIIILFIFALAILGM
jgi:hypothetical protein